MRRHNILDFFLWDVNALNIIRVKLYISHYHAHVFHQDYLFCECIDSRRGRTVVIKQKVVTNIETNNLYSLAYVYEIIASYCPGWRAVNQLVLRSSSWCLCVHARMWIETYMKKKILKWKKGCRQRREHLKTVGPIPTAGFSTKNTKIHISKLYAD